MVLSTMTVAIRQCARCGGDHDPLLFYRFDRPPEGAEYWAECPVSGDPILMHVETSDPATEAAGGDKPCE